MHRTLARQMRRLGIERDTAPSAEQWKLLVDRINVTYKDADQDRYTLERALDLSSAEMRRRYDELSEAQDKLVEASRKAGMADVAASVLHNVGNVLNSVNVSANMVSQCVQSPVWQGLTKTLGLLKAQGSPGRFIEDDPRGRKVLPYLDAVDAACSEERAKITQEVEVLSKHIEHIKTIVSEQLSAARGDRRHGCVVEPVRIAELLDDALAVLSSTLPWGHRISFRIDGSDVTIHTDRHKVFQIVLNLLTNARDAVMACPGPRTVTVRAHAVSKGRVAIEVEDNGAGIEPDCLARIFGHGFTTKPEGHGFGLHASACAAAEMRGNLACSSGGAGTGATFRLLLLDSADR